MAANLFTGVINNNWGTAGNWSLLAVPTASDGNTATFNITSPACTVDTSARVCNSLDFSTYANTITMSQNITVSGNIILGSGMTITGAGSLGINATATATSNGKIWPNTLLVSLSPTITLADNWTITGTYTNTNGVTTINGNTLNVGGGLTMTNGTLNGSTNIILNGTGTWTAAVANAFVANNLTINTTGTTTIGTVYYNTGTLTYSTGTVITTGSSLNLLGGTINTSGMDGITTNRWGNINFGGASATYTLTSNLYTSTQINMNTGSGTQTINGFTIYTSGNIANSNGICLGTTNIVMDGTGNLSAAGVIRNNLTINTTGGTITCTATGLAYNTGTLTYSAGTVIATASTLSIAASTTLNTNGINWNNITCSGTLTITNNSDLTCNGTLQFLGTSATVTINGNTLYCGGNITFPGTAEILNGTTNIVYNGTGTWAATTNSTCKIKNNLTINTTGTLTLGNGVQQLGYDTGTLTYLTGTLIFTNSDFFCSANTTLDWNGAALKNVFFQNGTINLLSNFSATGTLTHNQSVTYSGPGIWTCANFILSTAGAIVTLPASQTYRITNAMTSVGTNATHQGISSYNLLTNLSSYWKFDEGSGTTVSDVVGGKTLTFTTGNTWTEGIINSGITYGTSGRGSFAGIASTTSYAISMWIRPVTGAATYSNLFANTAAGFFYKSDTKKLSVYYLGDHLSTTPLTLSAWTHVCISVNNGNGTFYVNGIPDGTFTGATSFTPTNMGGDTANQYFRSSMDEVGFWLRPLTQAEVTVLYNTTGLPYSSFFTTLRSNLILNYGATQDNGFLNGTSINSSGGQTIWTYKGVLSGTINWNNLPTEPKTVGYSF